MTISDKLSLLEQTKEAQRVKLGLPEMAPFSRYHEFFEFKYVPSYLFLNGEQGVWFDPSDLTTLFQDVEGTKPVTKDGDPVGLILDKSQGLGYTSDLFNNQNIIKTYGARYADGVATLIGGEGSALYIDDLDSLGLKNLDFVEYEVEILSNPEGGVQLDFGLKKDNPNEEIRDVGVFKVKGCISNGRISFFRRMRGEYQNLEVRARLNYIKKLKGNHATQSTASARPIYRSGDGRGWINNLRNTEDFNKSGWGRSRVEVTITNEVKPPIKNVNVQKVSATGEAGFVYVQQQYNWHRVGTSFISSVYLKAGTYTHARLSLSQAANAGSSLTIDLTTGEYIHKLPTNNPDYAHSVEHVGDGWYRVSITRMQSNYSLNHFVVYVTNYKGNSDVGAAGEGNTPKAGEYIYMAAPQLQIIPPDADIPDNFVLQPYQANGEYLEGIATGLPTDLYWVEFDGVDDTLSTLNKVTLRQPITISCALSRSRDTATSNLFGIGSGVLGRFQIISISSGRVACYVRKLSGEYLQSGSGPVNSFPKDTSAVLTALLTDSSMIMRRNGSGEAGSSLGDTNGINDKDRVITINNSSQAHSQKFYGGVVILDTSLEGTKELIDLELFLAQKSGVTL